jgi:hypothetical protein
MTLNRQRIGRDAIAQIKESQKSSLVVITNHELIVDLAERLRSLNPRRS